VIVFRGEVLAEMDAQNPPLLS